MTPLSSGDCETSKRISWNNLVRLISALVLVLAPAVSEQPAWADEALTARNKAVVRDFYTTVLIGPRRRCGAAVFATGLHSAQPTGTDRAEGFHEHVPRAFRPKTPA
jgi:hypothetical protein